LGDVPHVLSEIHGYRGANTCLFALFLVIVSPCHCGACIPPTPTCLLLALCSLSSFFAALYKLLDLAGEAAPSKKLAYAAAFFFLCVPLSTLFMRGLFFYLASLPALFVSRSSVQINSFFTILRRAARLLFTVTDVTIHGYPHGRVGNERVHIGFLMSGTDHVTRRCIDLVAGVFSWWYHESTTRSSLTAS